MRPLKGKKQGEWIECDFSDFKTAKNLIQASGVALVEFKLNNQTLYSDKKEQVLMRFYEHKNSEQYLIHVSMSGHLPSKFEPSKEASIYE